MNDQNEHPQDAAEVGRDNFLAVEPVKIHSSHAKFAKAVADIADAYGMRRFDMTYDPDWKSPSDSDRRISGKMRIQYEAKDGRGRPSRELQVSCESQTIVSVIKEPKSYN